MEKTESDSDTRKMEKNGKTCSKTESDSDTEVKVSSLHTYFRNIFFNGYILGLVSKSYICQHTSLIITPIKVGPSQALL